MHKLALAALIGMALLPMVPLGSLDAADHPDGIAAATAKLLDTGNGDDWPGYGRSFGEQHFSPLDEINDGTVGRLKLAWSMDLGPGNPASQPIEVDGTLYFSMGMSIVHAVDASTGELLWKYDPEVSAHGGKELRLFWGTRGIAWWNGKVYTSTGDGRLVAIDARTGKPVWSVKTTEGSGQYITGAPRVFGGKVIIGQAGGDFSGTRGFVTTYDAETGKRLWRFHMVPGDPAKGFENKAMEMAAKTWTGEWWKMGGGGQPWNAMSYDPETNIVMIGTGNGYPWNQRVRSPGGGDNLFLCSLVALDADTGEYKWHYQYNPGETWDYNSTTDIALADILIDGKVRKVAMSAPKNGFLYVIDRTNGKLISAEKIAKATWATRIDLTTGRPVEVPEARYPGGKDFELWPSTRGAHGWAPMSYSPQTRLVYIPKLEWGMTLNDRGIDPKDWKADTIAFGPPKPGPLVLTSALIAWDPKTQTKMWEVPNFGGITGGTLATAGNLVFQGQINGRLSAYAANTGKELWRFDAQAPIVTGPISYLVGGKQFVTLLVGMGTGVATPAENHGGIQIDYRTQKKRVLTFVLDGTAKLPPPPPAFVVKAPPDPDYRPNPSLAAKGAALYNKNCWLCHGVNAVSGAAAPDLRGSDIPFSMEAFAFVVRDGALAPNGMPNFAELSEQDLLALRQYFRSRAADLRTGGH